MDGFSQRSRSKRDYHIYRYNFVNTTGILLKVWLFLIAAMSLKPEDDFDSIIFAESEWREKGFTEGIKHGERLGREIGIPMGIQKGREVAEEIVFYLGFSETFINILEMKPRDNSDKVTTILKRTIALITTLTQSSPKDDNYCELISNIRANFKRVASILKVSVGYKNKDVSSYKF